jgi:hypothetical protein
VEVRRSRANRWLRNSAGAGVLVAGLLRPSNRDAEGGQDIRGAQWPYSIRHIWEVHEAVAELERKIEGELEKAAATIADVKDVEQERLNQSTDL